MRNSEKKKRMMLKTDIHTTVERIVCGGIRSRNKIPDETARKTAIIKSAKSTHHQLTTVLNKTRQRLTFLVI